MGGVQKKGGKKNRKHGRVKRSAKHSRYGERVRLRKSAKHRRAVRRALSHPEEAKSLRHLTG